MRNTLLLIALTTAISGGTLSAGGWSHKQGQDTVKGGVFGAVAKSEDLLAGLASD